jgi:CheY-like chemotaxis protein
MASTTVSDTIIIVDDELQNALWMVDYFDAKGFNSLLAGNVNEAIELIDSEIYRALILDLNIPMLPPYDVDIIKLGEVYAKYPGLFVARHARNRGYRNRQVVLYSVHKDPLVSAEAKKLDCTYILKGRPREVKAELDSVLSFDPTTE